MTDYRQDLAFTENYIDAVRAAIGPLFISVAPPRLDKLHATDLVIMRGKPNIAVRIRRAKFFLRSDYRRQFTIRSWRTSGMETELAKLERGEADWMFYGFAADEAAS